MYDDISTFKKKANLADVNFRAIAHNNDNDNAIAEVGDPAVTVDPARDDTGRRPPDSGVPKSAGTVLMAADSADGKPAPASGGEQPLAPSPRPAPFANEEDLTAGDDTQTGASAIPAIIPQHEINDIFHHEIPLFSLFKSIAAQS